MAVLEAGGALREGGELVSDILIGLDGSGSGHGRGDCEIMLVFERLLVKPELWFSALTDGQVALEFTLREEADIQSSNSYVEVGRCKSYRSLVLVREW